MTIAASFAAAADRALLLPYGMAGLPSAEASVDVFAAMADAGADGFEIGIPYADPLMDGPVIQAAGERALAGGMSLRSGLGVAGAVAARTGLPCFVMTYVNPVLRMGIDAFCDAVSDAGCEGMIVADLPGDEAGPFREAAARAGVGVVPFAAPTTTDDRLGQLANWRAPFVYGIAEMGVTGERARSGGRAAELVTRIRARTDTPVALGVGISGPESAAAAAAIADAVIVGSALVRRVLEAPGPSRAAVDAAEAVAALRAAMRRHG
jgi:tryptophan synthase alpha chain